MNLDLFDSAPVQPLARRRDPVTSKKAAERAQSFKASHEAAIFGAIHEAGKHGATYTEIAARTRMEPVAVARRLSDMGRRGLIYRNGEKRGGRMVWCKA